MQDLEFNKIAAAVLTAGIMAMVCGILAGFLVHPKPLEKNVYMVAGVAVPQKGEASNEPKGPEPIDKLMATADAKTGEEITKKCSVCHTFNKGGPNKIGPNLFGVFGEPIGQGKGYSFSEALSKHGGKWDVAALNHWLWKPQSFARGTKMTFVGLPKAKDRADVIAYLESLK